MILFCMHFQNTSFGSNYMLLQPILRLLQSFRLSYLPYLIRLTPQFVCHAWKIFKNFVGCTFCGLRMEVTQTLLGWFVIIHNNGFICFFIRYKLQIKTIIFEKNIFQPNKFNNLNHPPTTLCSAISICFITTPLHQLWKLLWF